MSSMYPPYGGQTRLCQRCRAPLPPNEFLCANCGHYNLSPQMSSPTSQAQPTAMPWGGSTSSTSYGSGQYGGQQPAPYTGQLSGFSGGPSGQYDGQPSGFYGGQGHSLPAPQAGLSAPYGQSPAQPASPPFGGPSMPQQPFYSPPTTLGGFQQGSTNGFQPSRFDLPPPKRGSRMGLIIGVILLIVLVIGGIGGFVLLKNHNSKTSTSTATAQPTSTPSVAPLFRDSFQNNNNGWDTTGDPGKFSIKLGGGSLILEDDNHQVLAELVPGKTFTDFVLAVDATLSKGDPNNGYGIFIRAALDQQNNFTTYYCFELYGDGTYAVFKGTVDTGGNPTRNKLTYQSNDAIKKQGNVNHVEITAKGSSMNFAVNGTTLYTLNDTNYKSGAAALFVSNLLSPIPPGAQATFTNLVVYPV